VFSMRVDSLPTLGTQATWSVLFNTDADNTTIEWALTLDGGPDDRVELMQVQPSNNGPQITALVPVDLASWTGARADYSSFTPEAGGNYVNIAIPETSFNASVLEGDASKSWQYTAGTSTTPELVNKDLIGTGNVEDGLTPPQGGMSVPEPATWLLMSQGAIGYGLLALRLYRRKHHDLASPLTSQGRDRFSGGLRE
jgi:hypothetical protein